MNNNLPDNCQGDDPSFPWNEPEQEVYICWNCSEETDEYDLTELETPRNGLQSICEDCIEDYKI